MRRRLIRGAALSAFTLTAFTLAAPAGLAAQTAAAIAPPAPAVGDTAPDFVLPGATAAGAAGPIRLSDFRGKTVVLAFFFKARTKG
jgi:hypothetical protein